MRKRTLLAIAFVIGTAFAALLSAFVADLIMPIIGMIFGKPDFSAETFTINNSHFFYGTFITAAITFISIGLAVFFFIVKPYEAATGLGLNLVSAVAELHGANLNLMAMKPGLRVSFTFPVSKRRPPHA